MYCSKKEKKKFKVHLQFVAQILEVINYIGEARILLGGQLTYHFYNNLQIRTGFVNITQELSMFILLFIFFLLENMIWLTCG